MSLDMSMVAGMIEALGDPADPEVIEQAVSDWLDDHPEAACPIDDTAGEGDTGKVWSADKSAGEVSTLTEAIANVKRNVKDFGVKGDGTTDDTAAINALFANGGVFYFPAGTYKISGTITLPDDSEMYGDGDSTVIDMYSCDDLEDVVYRSGEKFYPYIFVDGDNTKLHDFKLIGNTTTQNKRHAGVLVADAENCIISNLTVYNINYYASQTEPNVSAYGISAVRSERVVIDHCYVEQCGYECIGIADDCAYCDVTNNITLNGWRTCIQIHRGAHDVKVIGNQMIQNSQAWDACFTLHGITNQGIKNVRLENNVFVASVAARTRTDNYAAVIQLMSSTDGLWVVNNRVESGDRDLFSSESNDHLYLIGNLFQGNATSDYRVKINTANPVIVGNVLENTTGTTQTIPATAVGYGNIGFGDTIINGSGVNF